MEVYLIINLAKNLDADNLLLMLQCNNHNIHFYNVFYATVCIL